MLAEAASSEGSTQAGGSTSKLTHLAVGPSQGDLSIGMLECPHSMAAGFL